MNSNNTLPLGGNFMVVGETGCGKTDYQTQVMKMLMQTKVPEEKPREGDQHAK